MPKRFAFTRDMVTALDKYPRSTMAEIAAEIGCSKSSVHRYLVILGSIEQWPSLNVPAITGNEKRCTRCRIILSEAPEGKDGECGWCMQEEDYLVKLWTGEQRTPGYVIDVGELVLAKVEGRQ